MINFKQFLIEELSAMSNTPETIEKNEQPPVSKLTLANKQQIRNNPMVSDEPLEMEDRQTPEEKWDDVFNRDNFYKIWNSYWEELYGKGYTNQKERDAEFERIIDLMRRKFIKAVNGIGQGEAFNDAIRLFISYFNQPTEA